MDISKYFEGEEPNFWGDKETAYYITGKETDFRVIYRIMGAYDEDGEESVGYGAEILINGIQRGEDAKLDEVEKLVKSLTDDVCIGYIPTFMDHYYNVYKQISILDYSYPDHSEMILEKVIELLAS